MKEGMFVYGDCSVIISRDDGKWHPSLAHPARLRVRISSPKADIQFAGGAGGGEEGDGGRSTSYQQTRTAADDARLRRATCALRPDRQPA